ncbi:MAG: methyltransferase domain-containing protein [Dictyoglomaceae bacterium]
MDYKWYVDQISEDQFHCYEISEVLVDIKTPWQKIQIIRNKTLGKCLVIDGKIQSTEADEYIYHESLIHPPLILHTDPRDILVVGVGEGATLRELLKYPEVNITAVEIDPEVINFAEQYLEEWHQGAFKNPRVKLIYDDGWNYLKNTSNSFDVIILDLPEPYPNTPAYRLYTPEFYKMVWEKLNPYGIMATQGETTQLGQQYKHFWIKENLRKVFGENVYSYQAYIPSFDSSWGFLIAGKDKIDPFKDKKEIDELINKRIKEPLRFYDGITHLSLFYLPKYLRD